MKRSWVIWTVILVVFGGLGLAAVVIDIHREKRQIAGHKARYGQGADEYLQQYLAWSTLPADERIENPWGQGRYGGTEIREKLIHQQPDRLRADLADLASGTTTPGEVAEVLYGPGWQREVEQYRSRCDVRDAIAVGSTVSIMAGLIVSVGYALHHSLRGMIAQPPAKDASREKGRRKRRKPAGRDDTASEDEPAGADLLSEIVSAAAEDEPESDKDTRHGPSIGVKNEAIGYFRNFGLAASDDRTAELKNALRSQAANFRPTAAPETGGGAVGTLMSSSPVASELTELTQEVSAIREFAAQQQDRVRQLQDGYDWGIIKRFCLRIIRCIDNLDERIKTMPLDGPDRQGLLDVRDELVFSLESSGVEQFEPEINSEYKGIEKSAEAVKGRESAPDEALVGKIAAVVRPGYRYIVSDDDVKIVRCAQVKLYGESLKQSEEE